MRFTRSQKLFFHYLLVVVVVVFVIFPFQFKTEMVRPNILANVVVDQLAKWSLPVPEVRGLNPAIDDLLSTILKRRK